MYKDINPEVDPVAFAAAVASDVSPTCLDRLAKCFIAASHIRQKDEALTESAIRAEERLTVYHKELSDGSYR